MPKKTNYYVEQIDTAIKNHDIKYELQIKISGSKNNTKYMTLPLPLAQIIKEWYWLHGDKI